LSNEISNCVKNTDFSDLLNEKANKQTFNNALNRKVNKSDLEAILVNKADSSSMEELLNLTKTKINCDYFESHINRIMDTKIDRQELYNVKELISTKLDQNN